MIKKVDHIGIVVHSLAATIPLYRDVLGLEYINTEVVPDGSVRVAFFKTGDVKIELIEPIDNPGVQKFLETRGGGLHHVCYESTDLKADLAALAQQGVRLLDKEPRDGAHHMKVAFAHPKDLAGVLVELAQPAKEYEALYG